MAKNIPKSTVLYILFLTYLAISLYQLYSSPPPPGRGLLSDFQNWLKAPDISITKKISGEIKEQLPQNPSTKIITQAVMEYIHNNSIHKIDDEYQLYAFNTNIVLEKLHLASNGNSEEKPHLSCGPRSYAMRELLKSFNIYSRLVQLYSDNFGTHAGHRLLEVFNREENSWEVWDPDYGVTYIDRNTRKPIDIITMIFSDSDNIIPVGLSGEGWENTGTRTIKDNYLKAVLFESAKGMRNALIVVNISAFNIEKKYSSGVNFSDWAHATYGNPRIIYLPIENAEYNTE
jgi:hypothetical protein